MPSVSHRHAEYRHSPATAPDRDPYRRLRPRGSDSLARNLFGCSIRTFWRVLRPKNNCRNRFRGPAKSPRPGSRPAPASRYHPDRPRFSVFDAGLGTAPRNDRRRAGVVRKRRVPVEDSGRGRRPGRRCSPNPTCAARSRCSSTGPARRQARLRPVEYATRSISMRATSAVSGVVGRERPIHGGSTGT